MLIEIRRMDTFNFQRHPGTRQDTDDINNWLNKKLVTVHFWCHLIGGIGMGAFMGMAGLKGMLRRSLYINGEFNIYMIVAAICGTLMLIGFIAFFYNIVMSVGFKGVIGIFTPSKRSFNSQINCLIKRNLFIF